MRRNDFRFFRAGLSIAGLFLLTTCAMLAQGNSPVIQQAYSHLDRNVGLESNLSKMALKKSQNTDVKKFAHQIISENNTIASRMFTYSNRDGYILRGGPAPAEVAQAQKKMKQLTGTDFDKVYLTQIASLVNDDMKAVQDAGSPKDESELSAICTTVQSQSSDRMKQIHQLAAAENYNIEGITP